MAIKLGDKELFTAEQLPPSHVMLVVKKPDGEELAAVISVYAGDHRVLQTFDTLKAVLLEETNTESVKFLGQLAQSGVRRGAGY